MFEGFALQAVTVGDLEVRARIGGEGPPLLLLHGNPQTHVMWHLVAPRLADRFTVVAPDLRGYGKTTKPAPTQDRSNYSKRVMALDQIELMRHLGHQRFAVAGHDRGGRVGYRMALDHPGVVTSLAVLDIVPTIDSFERGGRTFGLGQYHWFFLAQPSPLPERLIGADPEWWWRWHTRRGSDPSFFHPDALADYLGCFTNPETIRGMCEDYRAGATIDCEHDLADRASGRRIACPLLVLWGARAALPALLHPLEVWGEWADQVTGGSLPCGHYLAEEEPMATAERLLTFFTAQAPASPA